MKAPEIVHFVQLRLIKVLPKSRTKSFDPLRQHSGGVLTCGDVLVKFVWGQLRQVPLAAVLVVIIHPAVNRGIRVCKGCPTWNLTSQLVLHVSEEALLRSVVPAVAPAGHGPAQLPALHQLDKLQAGVVGPLVAMDHSPFVQRGAMVLHQPLHHLQDKIRFQRFTFLGYSLCPVWVTAWVRQQYFLEDFQTS